MQSAKGVLFPGTQMEQGGKLQFGALRLPPCTHPKTVRGPPLSIFFRFPYSPRLGISYLATINTRYCRQCKVACFQEVHCEWCDAFCALEPI